MSEIRSSVDNVEVVKFVYHFMNRFCIFHIPFFCVPKNPCCGFDSFFLIFVSKRLLAFLYTLRVGRLAFFGIFGAALLPLFFISAVSHSAFSLATIDSSSSTVFAW